MEMSEKTKSAEKPEEIPKDEQVIIPEDVSSFSLKPVKKIPPRTYRKGSKYDPILDEFLKSDHKLVEVDVKGKEANYIRTQLNKRIEARTLEKKVKVKVISSVVYLEKA